MDRGLPLLLGLYVPDSLGIPVIDPTWTRCSINGKVCSVMKMYYKLELHRLIEGWSQFQVKLYGVGE